MPYRDPPERLIEETKAIIRLYYFLRHDCGLIAADKLSAKQLRELLSVIKQNQSK